MAAKEKREYVVIRGGIQPKKAKPGTEPVVLKVGEKVLLTDEEAKRFQNKIRPADEAAGGTTQAEASLRKELDRASKALEESEQKGEQSDALIAALDEAATQDEAVRNALAMARAQVFGD